MEKTIPYYILYKKDLHYARFYNVCVPDKFYNLIKRYSIMYNPDRWAKDVVEKPIDYLKDKYPLIYYIDKYIFEKWYVVPLFIILTIIYILFRLV